MLKKVDITRKKQQYLLQTNELYYFCLSNPMYYMRVVCLSSIFCFHASFRPSSAMYVQGRREISAIIVTDDYLCYKEPKIPYNFFYYFNI